MPADPQPALPRNFIRPCLLLLLREQPSHGYELLERLRAFGFERDPGGLYRALRTLEHDGYVRSAWQRSNEGPERRIYELTRPGMEALHQRAKQLAASERTLALFRSRYSEFVTLANPERRRTPSPVGARRT